MIFSIHLTLWMRFHRLLVHFLRVFRHEFPIDSCFPVGTIEHHRCYSDGHLILDFRYPRTDYLPNPMKRKKKQLNGLNIDIKKIQKNIKFSTCCFACDNLMRCVSYALNFGSASSMNEKGTRLWETLIFPTYITSKNCELLGEMSGMAKLLLLLFTDEFPLLLLLKLLLLST